MLTAVIAAILFYILYRVIVSLKGPPKRPLYKGKDGKLHSWYTGKDGKRHRFGGTHFPGS
jgi:hypothetical protein